MIPSTIYVELGPIVLAQRPYAMTCEGDVYTRQSFTFLYFARTLKLDSPVNSQASPIKQKVCELIHPSSAQMRMEGMTPVPLDIPALRVKIPAPATVLTILKIPEPMDPPSVDSFTAPPRALSGFDGGERATVRILCRLKGEERSGWMDPAATSCWSKTRPMCSRNPIENFMIVGRCCRYCVDSNEDDWAPQIGILRLETRKTA